jgi:deoxyribodipyrimidine photo-lyase
MSGLPPTRAAALARLEAFVPKAGLDYAEKRNTDAGPGRPSAVSGLSPYIRHRLVTEAEVAAAVLARHPWPDAEEFIHEVCWRSYWKFWLEQRPSVWDDYRLERDAALKQVETDNALRGAYGRAVAGETGIACFDTWARELTAQNTLHNHARMWFASIWVFTLRLPWALGADLFLRHLLDGDAASNTLSWRWVMGCQTRGKHYVATAANIARFTEGRFDPAGELNETPAPIIGEAPPAPLPLPRLPCLPSGPIGLLLHDDDFGVESLVLGKAAPRAIAAVACPAARSPLGCADAVTSFVTGARDDAAARGAALYGVPARSLPAEPAALLHWAETAGVGAVIMPACMVGWTATSIGELARALQSRGLSVHIARRAWDEACWPHTTRGFFPFREQIPRILQAAFASGNETDRDSVAASTIVL